MKRKKVLMKQDDPMIEGNPEKEVPETNSRASGSKARQKGR